MEQRPSTAFTEREKEKKAARDNEHSGQKKAA